MCTEQKKITYYNLIIIGLWSKIHFLKFYPIPSPHLYGLRLYQNEEFYWSDGFSNKSESPNQDAVREDHKLIGTGQDEEMGSPSVSPAYHNEPNKYHLHENEFWTRMKNDPRKQFLVVAIVNYVESTKYS